jgi:hypothetical protein
MLEFTDFVVIRKMLDQGLDIAADGVRISVLGTDDAAVLAIGAVTMTLDNEAILNLEGSLCVASPFGYLPCFSW